MLRIASGLVPVVGLALAVIVYALTGWLVVFFWWLILCLLAGPLVLLAQRRR